MLSAHNIYMANCISLLIQDNCPSPLMCAINCAANGIINTNSSKIIPFNNYGNYYLRIRICQNKVHPQKYSRYSLVDTVACNVESDFENCNRWIPPRTFVPVALPINTTYIEVDSCEYRNGNFTCLNNPKPVRVYGNRFLFPSSFEVSPTNTTSCSTNSKFIINKIIL